MVNRDKQILNDLKNNNSISLRKFLIFYCGICDNNILSHNITHKDVKTLLPELKRVSYEYIFKNLKEVYTGSIVLVKDSVGNFAPYLNPKIDVVIDDNFYLDMQEEDKKDIFEEIINLENLNLYELVEVAKKYKNDNRLKEYRQVCRIIKKRKENDIKIYHDKKEKIILKGRDENDKY